MTAYIHPNPLSIEEEIAFLEDSMKMRLARFYEELTEQNYSDAMVLMKLMAIIQDNISCTGDFMKKELPTIMEHYKKYYNHYHGIKDDEDIYPLC